MDRARLVSVCLAVMASGVARAQTGAPVTQVAAERDASADSKSPPRRESPAAEHVPELDILTFHRSNYLVTGFTPETQVKFQFSFKYDLWPSTGRHTVYLAYTQKSLWDVYAKSAPFRESNYAPEVFYAHYHSDVHGQPNPGCGMFGEQLGFEHESNGEDGEVSRAWNRVFVNLEAACSGAPLYGLLGLRLWYPFLVGENRTIAKTQGYGELVLGVGIDHDASHMNGLLTLTLRKGWSTAPEKGSLAVDARWRPTYQQLLGKAWRFAPFLWGQFFAGYGETLGTYDAPTLSARLGIGFSDRAR
jgi:outer membrane phospholipase A